MSVARSVPELSRAKIAPWMNGHREREAQVGVGREARDVRGRVEPRRVHREQEQREDHRRDDRGRLPDRAQEGAPGDLRDLSRRAGPHAGTASCSPVATSAPSPAPSSLRPVLARKTSSRVGACSWRSARSMPSESSSRTTACEAVVAGREPDRDGLPAGVELPAPGAEAAHHLDQPRAVGRIGRGRLDRGLADLGLERGGGALGDDLAAIDDPDAIGEAVGLLEVLGGEEDGHALVVREPLDLLPERGPALRVEPGGGLVEKEDPRAMHERQREVEAPPHAARVAADAAIRRLGQPDALDQLVAAAATLRLRHPVKGGLKPHVLARRQMRIERRLLQRRPDRLADLAPLLGDVEPAHRRPSVGGRQQGRQHQHRRRLARAVGAEEAVDLAGVDVQVDAVDRARPLLELLDEAVDPDRSVIAHDRDRSRFS